ncbi:alpha/beta hydrolase [Pseudalkalibacillus hwajinpoensis]|uniref:alpha/beta hydrolase n=1 Tax=Guptibacillus hwajinpoensis TaxID=208199 RepID=UPI00325AF01A
MGIFSKKVDYTVSQTGISSSEEIMIGGIRQTILIQAEDQTKPVLLILHGGPSMPLPGVSSKGRDYTIVTNTRELVKHYVLVYWDQRGTGKSYRHDIPGESMTVSQFVSDANELTDYLRTRFKHPKIFLAAHSWGSTIGLELVTTFPDKFYSYVGLSQVVSWTENDRLSLEWTKAEAKRRGHTKALVELESVGEPPFVESFQQWGVLRKWQRKFNTLIYSDDVIKHPGLMNVTKAMFQSDEYSLKDIYNTYYKGFKLVYTDSFIKELAANNFMESVQKVAIPITFIHGMKDYHVHGQLVKTYYDQLNAREKRLLWVDKSAHLFHPDDTKLIEKYLIEQLRHRKLVSK